MIPIAAKRQETPCFLAFLAAPPSRNGSCSLQSGSVCVRRAACACGHCFQRDAALTRSIDIEFSWRVLPAPALFQATTLAASSTAAMAIRVALHHVTEYRYDRPVTIQ